MTGEDLGAVIERIEFAIDRQADVQRRAVAALIEAIGMMQVNVAVIAAQADRGISGKLYGEDAFLALLDRYKLVEDPPVAAVSGPLFAPAAPNVNEQGTLCGLCDSTSAHEHPRFKCLRCKVEMLPEWRAGHVCKEPGA